METYYKLYLETQNNNLSLIYDNPDGSSVSIGSIRNSTHFHMLSMESQKYAYQVWIINGMEFDMTKVVYKDRSYWISRELELLSSDLNGNNIAHIYDLERAMPCPLCTDPNVECYHNGTPILY